MRDVVAAIRAGRTVFFAIFGMVAAVVAAGPALAAASFTYGATVPYNSGAAPATPIDVSGDATNSPTGYAVGSTTTSGGGSVSINSSGIASYTPLAGFRGTDSFTFTATNGSGTSGSATVTVPVGNPTITLSPTTLTAGTVGAAYSQSLSASGGKAPYTYSTTLASGALPSGLTLSSTGVISGQPTSVGTFSFTVSGTDSSTGSGPASFISSTITLTIAAPTLALAPGGGGTLTGTSGVGYSQAFAASGGTGPYTYTLSVTSGTMPSGLSFSGGTLSGTPTTASSVTFTVTATDTGTTGTGSPFSVSGSYTLTTSAPAITMAPATLPMATAGTAYSQTVAASGGVAPYSYAISSGALPTGLALNASTGAITGTPTAAGPFSFTIKATDANHFTGTQVYSFTVNPSTTTLAVLASLNPSVVGQSVTFTATVSSSSAGSPTGVVTFKDGAKTLGTGTLSNGAATFPTSALTGGPHAITAAYSGDGNFAGSTSPVLTQTVNVTSATTASLASSANPSAPGRAVTFTATVTSAGGTPTGAVTFSDGGAAIGTAMLASGVATFTTASLAAGAHSITATYGGVAGFAASTSSILTQTVAIPADSVKLRQMQVAVTKVVAQNSGQVIASSIDNAISDGFNDGGGLVTPSGTGLRFNFSADPDQPDASSATSSERIVSERWHGTFGSSTDAGGTSSYARNRQDASRIDGAFAAINRNPMPAKAPPLIAREPKEWMLWADVQGSGVDRWGSTIGSSARQLYGSQVNALIGLTRRITPNFLVGALGGYETFDYTSSDINGKLKGQG
jgi:hypothetical protein